jgi:hypothetical protein
VYGKCFDYLRTAGSDQRPDFSMGQFDHGQQSQILSLSINGRLRMRRQRRGASAETVRVSGRSR